MWIKVVKIKEAHLNTDQIIPGEYLTSDRPQELAKGLFAGMKVCIPQGEPWVLWVEGTCGSGSSREHAVWALQGAGCVGVVAKSFARIFRRNCVYGGMPVMEIEAVAFSPLEAQIDLQMGECRIKKESLATVESFRFYLSPFERHVLHAKGWLRVVAQEHMLSV